MLKKTLCCILCCIAIVCLTAPAVFASGDIGWVADPLSISFDFSKADPQIRGSVDLRLVAEIENGRLQSWADGFAEAGLSLEDLQTEEKADALFLYAESAKLPAVKVQIGEDGKGLIELEKPGLYLVSQMEPFAGYLCLKPALVCVPMRVEGEWICAVEASPKLEPVPEIVTTETTPPPPELPQTGQVNWPVPILLLLGSFLILLGLCLRREKKHEN